jgi:quinol monooxygenase YgiN
VIVVIGTFRLPDRAAAQAALERVVAASRAEAGCIGYAYAEDVLEPGFYRVNEAWVDRAALAAHFAAPHMERWRRERDELGMSDRKVTAYTVSGEEEL